MKHRIFALGVLATALAGCALTPDGLRDSGAKSSVLISSADVSTVGPCFFREATSLWDRVRFNYETVRPGFVRIIGDMPVEIAWIEVMYELQQEGPDTRLTMWNHDRGPERTEKQFGESLRRAKMCAKA